MAEKSHGKSSIMGPALTTAILLRDWDRYGLAERVCYHFDLAEALAASEHERGDPNNTNKQEAFSGARLPVCGVLRLLECIPTTQSQQMSKRHRRALRNSLLRFNTMAQAVMEERRYFCHEPPNLPLRLNPASRVFFAYETTRIAFVLDASPTLTSTFGFGASVAGRECCPLDRLVEMAQTFFTALVQPIPTPAATEQGIWKPVLAVSVLAVYPSQSGHPEIGLLVRDFRVTNIESAELLARNIQEWALGEVEAQIARRLANREEGTLLGRSRYDAWIMPSQASYLRDVLNAGDVSLGILSSAARPCIVIATDGCSVECDRIVDIISDKEREDIPVSILDLSSPASHDQAVSNKTITGPYDLLRSDPRGDVMPLHLSDDTETLHNICKATGGAFWDSQLLADGSKTIAGEVPPDSPLACDHFFSFSRHSMKPNAVQWYTLFSLSQLSPRPNSAWGLLPPPYYIREKRSKQVKSDSSKRSHYGGPGGDLAPRGALMSDAKRTGVSQIRTILSSYIINPIPIKGLLMMRVKEGYRAKQYGQSTIDPGKVSMQFTLPLEVGIVLHYELSYKALSEHNHRIGFAHVKIELSGEPSLIQMVKTDFVHGSQGRPSSTHQQASDRICELLRWMRKEDMLQSYLTPVRWTDQLSQPDTPFVKRLGSLTELQQRRHFRFDEFDSVCVGRMPYEHDDDDFLSQFRDTDDGSNELIETIANWSSQTIKEQKRFVKQTKTGKHDLPAYCIVEVRRSAPGAQRLWTITVETLGGSRASDRLSILSALRRILSKLQNVEVLPKQMGRFLTGVANEDPEQASRNAMIEKQHNHASWDLVMDPELLPLLMKRRTEIGHFLLLESSDDHALFAKIVVAEHSSEPGTLVQYQLAMMEERVVVDFHMERQGGMFSLRRQATNKKISRFQRMAGILRRRDQECGLALQCRTALLRIFDGESLDPPHRQLSYAQKLLEYSSLSTIKLRFFHQSSLGANEKLRVLTEEMLLSQTLGPRVVKLMFEDGAVLGGKEPGDWFLVEYDKHTTSLIHISHSLRTKESNTDESSVVYAEVSFFTVGIGDLYSRRDDVADDGSDDGHISEHLCVTELADFVETGHKRNYASAAYLAAVENTECGAHFKLHPADFIEVMNQLDFVEIATVLVPGEQRADQTGSRSRLSELIDTVLQKLSGEDFCLAYKKGSHSELLFHADDESSVFESFESSTREISRKTEEDDLSGTPGQSMAGIETELSDDEVEEKDDSLDGDLEIERPRPSSFGTAPMFVRFLLDGKPASVQDLASVDRSASLSALVSVYSESEHGDNKIHEGNLSDLPSSHVNVAAEMGSLLNAYVAEQTLERLRHHGPSIEEADLRLARTCLRKARYVMASTIDVYFYASKSDTMVPASAPAGANAEVEEGFKILSVQLLKNEHDTLKSFGDGNSFFVVDAGSEGAILAYLCFVRLRRSRGTIAVEVYHPEGPRQASFVLERMHNTISHCCHRTNQIMLLNRLHRSRTASSLLILQDPETSADKNKGIESQLRDPFYPGVFSCPILFRTSFDLFHRCATNPAQVARTVEATVLHIFSISNRRSVFVYKDEDGSVFYMELSTSGGGLEPDGKIELLVYGVDPPGPSVTQQLRSLLQRRLHLIAVDMLSSVLTKNPRYLWKKADLNFVKTFESELSSLDGNDSHSESSTYVCTYEYPKNSLDPAMMLMYFRQNLCGSTFFHPLMIPDRQAARAVAGMPPGASVPSLHLMFYYNNATSKLDPALQALSTLTKKGAEYSRQAGTGIAIVEVSLVDTGGKQLPEIPKGSTLPTVEHPVDLTLDLLKPVGTTTSGDESGSEANRVFVQVRITGAALKRDVLHEWIKLTLDQALSAWNIECLLDWQMRDAVRYREESHTSPPSCATKEQMLDDLCPGLQALVGILETTTVLPHPAVLKFQYDGVVRSSMVADIALDLLEGVIVDQLAAETKDVEFYRKYSSDLSVIRLSRNEQGRRVELSRDPKSKKAVVNVVSHGSRSIIRDAPIDCPEYIAFYSISPDAKQSPPKLFEGVVIDDGTGSEVVEILEALRGEKPRLFQRRFAFIFSVKRNKRTLLVYNWSTQLFKNTSTRLLEKENQLLTLIQQSAGSLQRRSLRALSPFTDRITKNGSRAGTDGYQSTYSTIPDLRVSDSSGATTSEKNDNSRRSAPRRRLIGRPLNIRRPKLIGKSVEGSAMHAVAASRARASSNMFKTAPSTGTSGPGRKNTNPSRRGVPTRAQVKGPASQTDSFQTTNSSSKEDKELASLRRYYEMALVGAQARLHTEHFKAAQASTFSLWPVKDRTDIPVSVAEAVLQESALCFTDLSELIPLPPRLRKTFLSSFVKRIVTWNPEISIVPIRDQKLSANSMMISGQIRAVRSSKCVAVARLSVVQVKNRGEGIFLALEAFLLALPRREKDSRPTSKERRYSSRALSEKDACGADVLSFTLQKTLGVAKLLFDHAASIAEGALKSFNGDLTYDEVLALVQGMIAKYTLTQQRKLLRSDYKSFQASIVLKSFGDPFISKYDGPTLFDWLRSNSGGRSMMSCGKFGQCFKQEVVVRGTRSMCFLTLDSASPEKLRLVILCRTLGKDLHEFMFRDGSNIAISIVDNIAVECAQLAYEELRHAARLLNRDKLWSLVSSAGSSKPPSTTQLEDLIRLCSVKPAFDYLKVQSDFHRFEMLCKSDVMGDWSHFCSLLENEKVFTPSWALRESQRIFYSRSEDIFFILKAGAPEDGMDIKIVEKEDEFSSSPTKAVFALQKLLNYLLLSLWGDISSN